MFCTEGCTSQETGGRGVVLHTVIAMNAKYANIHSLIPKKKQSLDGMRPPTTDCGLSDRFMGLLTLTVVNKMTTGREK